MGGKNIYFQCLKKNIFDKFLNKKISELLDKKYSFVTSNCTSAIYLLLKSLNFKNKKIIIPSNICFDVFLSIIYSQNYPLVIDINNNLGFSLEDLKKELKKQKNISAIIFPYLYGNSENFNNILKLMKKNNILLIEDIAGSLGGRIGKKRFGTFSDYCVGSFGQGKIIDMKKGGFFATNNLQLYKKFIENNNKLKNYSSKSVLLYEKLNSIQNLILKNKNHKIIINPKILKKYFNGIIHKRNFNKNFYIRLNKEIDNIDKINTLRNKKAQKFSKLLKFKDFRSVNHLKGSVYWRKNFLIKKNSSNLISYLNKKGIYARKYYPPLNLIFPFLKKKFINCQKNYSKIVNFWVGEETKIKDIYKIKKLIKNYYNVNKTSFTPS